MLIYLRSRESIGKSRISPSKFLAAQPKNYPISKNLHHLRIDSLNRKCNQSFFFNYLIQKLSFFLTSSWDFDSTKLALDICCFMYLFWQVFSIVLIKKIKQTKNKHFWFKKKYFQRFIIKNIKIKLFKMFNNNKKTSKKIKIKIQ